MILPSTVEYALRATAYLATRPEGEALTAAAISERTGVPLHYLSKVLRKLVLHDVLSAQKGHHGGFALARVPSKIRVADVLDAVEYESARGQCSFGWGQCNSRQPCPLHPLWSQLNDAFAAWASKSTLADVGPYPESRAKKQLKMVR